MFVPVSACSWQKIINHEQHERTRTKKRGGYNGFDF